MVLRKPYAFLIKHFKIIHLLLGALMVYLVIRTTGIITFFNNFASTGVAATLENNIAGKYINFFMYGAIILILISGVTVYLLMRSKEKPTKFYTGVIIYYIILFILITVIYSFLSNLQIKIVDTQVIRVYRDVSLIIYLPQFFFIFYSFFRGIGFDIKKFNFGKDLDELDISDKDSEEIEVVIKTDTYKIERKLRRLIREFKYYILENKFIFTCILVIFVIILGTTIYFNRGVYNKTYKANQTFTYQGFRMENLNSVVTNLDYTGRIIQQGKYYLVLTFNVNNVGFMNAINKNNFRLLIDKEILYPTYEKNEYFQDYGMPYSGQDLKNGTNNDYLIVYELTEKQVSSKYRLRIVDRYDFKIGEIVPTYKDLVVRPKTIDTIKDKGTAELGDTLTFKGTTVNDSLLTVNKIEITDTYRYEYNFCYEGKCDKSNGSIQAVNSVTTPMTLMVIDYHLSLADSYYKTNIRTDRQFFNSFAKIKYTIDNNTKIIGFSNKTPTNFTDKSVLQLNSEIKSASSIEMIITIRSNQYIIKLK